MVTASSVGKSGGAIIVSAETSPAALKIRDAFLAESGLEGADLRIEMDGNRAVISGIVLTEDQRELSLRIAGRYVGRDRVVDKIETGDQFGIEVCEA